MYDLIPRTIAEAIAAEEQAREAAEQHYAALHVDIIKATPPIPIPAWLYQDLGIEPPEPEPTPEEKALAILAPHLAWEPLYQP